MFGVYLHIPYCESKCFYCDFYSLGASDAVPQAYVQALVRAWQDYRAQHTLPAPDTLYFGGGTPSLLSPAQVAQLIDAIQPSATAEITLEANPHLVSAQTLAGYHSAGVNRLSLGIQTARDESLARLGRRHTAQQAREALALAQRAGFQNISGDLMLALPHYTAQELQETIDLLWQGGCTHVSSYLLKTEPNTIFGKHPPADLPEEDAAADFYLAAVAQLENAGYAQYEISNFAKAGYESAHNLLYWHCENYLGLGPAAHSCIEGKRFYTKGKLQAFLQAPACYEPDGVLGVEDDIMLGLRLATGLSLSHLRQKWGFTFTAQQMQMIATLCQHQLATLQNDVLRLTPKGMLLQNSILCELI